MFLTSEGELRGGQREEVWESRWNLEGSKNSIFRLGILGPAEDTFSRREDTRCSGVQSLGWLHSF